VTANLRLVILGLIGIVLVLVAGVVAIAIVQVVRGDDVDLPTALLGLIGTPIGALVGILAPTSISSSQAAASTASLKRASSRGK
jgi:hypothetical protein